MDIATAWAKLDHAAKPITLRCGWIPHRDEQENAERDIERLSIIVSPVSESAGCSKEPIKG